MDQLVGGKFFKEFFFFLILKSKIARKKMQTKDSEKFRNLPPPKCGKRKRP